MLTCSNLKDGATRAHAMKTNNAKHTTVCVHVARYFAVNDTSQIHPIDVKGYTTLKISVAQTIQHREKTRASSSLKECSHHDYYGGGVVGWTVIPEDRRSVQRVSV